MLRLPSETRAATIRSLTPAQATELLYTWKFWARPNQLAPAGIWRIWLILAGRGFGKTRSVVEWVRAQAEAGRAERIALVGATASDVRDVLVEGESGLLRISPPGFMPRWEPSKARIVWPNGVQAFTFSAEEPDRLRGKQHHAAACDELASWRYAETWDQLMFGLRLGRDPRCVISTTPQPTPIIRDLIKRAENAHDVQIVRGSTFDNRANLAPAFVDQIVRRYEGTRLGRQELYAEVLDDNPGALWKRSQIDRLRVTRAPPLERVLVAVDPAVSANAYPGETEENRRKRVAETGIVVVGLGDDGHGYVLDDCSLSATPNLWAKAVVRAFHMHRANYVVAEVNNGGDLVASNITTVDSSIHVESVHATRGKAIRAEPIAALYEQGRVHHVGSFPDLESQLCDWDPLGKAPSPDRLDALVWGLTELGIASGVDGPNASASTTYRLGSDRGF